MTNTEDNTNEVTVNLDDMFAEFGLEPVGKRGRKEGTAAIAWWNYFASLTASDKSTDTVNYYGTTIKDAGVGIGTLRKWTEAYVNLMGGKILGKASKNGVMFSLPKVEPKVAPKASAKARK